MPPHPVQFAPLPSPGKYVQEKTLLLTQGWWVHTAQSHSTQCITWGDLKGHCSFLGQKQERLAWTQPRATQLQAISRYTNFFPTPSVPCHCGWPDQDDHVMLGSRQRLLSGGLYWWIDCYHKRTTPWGLWDCGLLGSPGPLATQWMLEKTHLQGEGK